MADNGIMRLSLEITGQKVEQEFASWTEHISDLSEPLELIGEDLLGDFAQNMVVEGGFFGGTRGYLGDAGGPWKPLAESTVAERTRLGYGGAHPILWRTGDLGHALAERGAAGNVFEVGPDRLTVGASIFYALFHQDGTTRMPARPIVGLSRTRREGIVKRLGEYVRKTVAAAGLNSGGGGGGGGE
jgi:hypothetical protein